MTLPGVVVLGGSLGALEATSEVLRGAGPGLADVASLLVLHRSRGTGDLLCRLLSRDTPLTVVEPDAGEALQPGHLYVAPAGYHMLVGADSVDLTVGSRQSAARPSIDAMFESAAIAFGERVFGALLSSSSDDGLAGLLAIRARGGETRVQQPSDAESAEFLTLAHRTHGFPASSARDLGARAAAWAASRRS